MPTTVAEPSKDRSTRDAVDPAGLPAVKRRASSRGRYGRYRSTVRELDNAVRRGATDEELRDAAKAAGNDPDMRVTRRRSKKRARGFFTLFRAFWDILGNQRGRIIATLVVLTASTLVGLVSPYMTKIVIDHVIGTVALPDWLARLGAPTDRHLLLYSVVAVSMGVALTTLCLTLWARWQATKVSKRTVVTGRRIAFEHASKLPLQRVYDIKSGGVASILRDDAGGIGELTFTLLYNPWQAIVQLGGTLIVLALIRWELLVAALAVLPVVWFTHKTWISRIRPLFRDIRVTRQMTDSHATESFGGIRVVRTFNRRRSESATFTENNHLMARQELFAWWWMRGIDAAWQVIIPGSLALLLLFGGLLGIRGGITGGELTAFIAYLLALLQPIAALAHSATGFQNNLAGLDRTLDLLDEQPEFPVNPDSVVLRRDEVRGHVRIEDLHYAYPKASGELGEKETEEGEEVLRGINLDVPPGTTVAFVGPSGAGKTTLCNMIARFYDPTGGRITLDGRDLRDIDIDSYRRLLAIVEQDTFLFDGTIAQNIAYGNREASREEVIAAAKQANAHGFISDLPEGYDSHIGERGVKLSGGQRQRLTIARAILADPKILILDEATSNLDTESERLIQASLSHLMQGRTAFVIAHRLSTIQHAGLIAVVEGGTIVETGTHAELMRSSTRYKQMVELQTTPPAPPPPAHPGARKHAPQPDPHAVA